MNIETIELNAVAETFTNYDAFKLLAPSIGDLDLVGGGASTVVALG